MNTIVLAGGRSRRFGGNKLKARIDQKTILELLIGYLPKSKIIVVGEETELANLCVREEPLFGGPLAGILTAMPYVDSELVAIIAGDMPFAPLLIEQLIPSLKKDGVLPLDSEGVPQPLAAIYKSSALNVAFEKNPDVQNKSIKSLMDELDLDFVKIDRQELLFDIDTLEDLSKAIALNENLPK